MKKIYFIMFSLMFSVLLLAGCASSKKTGMEVKPNEAVIVDWDGRNYDSPAKPEWLKQFKNPKSEMIRKEFGIDKSYIIKYGIGSGKTEESAKVASKLNYNAIRAEELKTEVLSEAAKIINAEATARAAMNAHVDLTGHELVTQFWQEIEKYDSESDIITKEYICYSIYKISEENWKKTLKAYYKEVISNIPDSAVQNELAATITNVYENTTKEKSDAEFVDEVSAKINAIETGTTNTASMAPNPNDIGWLKVLETACELIF